MPEQTSNAEMRTLILDIVVELARKCEEAVMSSDLDFGRIQEKFDVAGTEWAVQVKYWTDDDLIRIDGLPTKSAGGAPELPPALAALFGQAGLDQEEDDTASFTFLLPRAWLPERAHHDG